MLSACSNADGPWFETSAPSLRPSVSLHALPRMNALSLRGPGDAQVTSRDVGAGGTQASGHSAASALSKTSRFVALERQASNLMPTDTNTFAFNAHGAVTDQPPAGCECTVVGALPRLRSPFIFKSRLSRRPVGGA